MLIATDSNAWVKEEDGRRRGLGKRR